jgi:predicted PurR-regulated permease PerM
MDQLADDDLRLFSRRVARALFLAVVTAGAIFLLGWVHQVLLTIFGGFVLGVFLHGVAQGVARRVRGVPHSTVVWLLVLMLLGLVAVVVLWLGPPLAAQIDQLVTRVPAAARDLVARLRQVPLLKGLMSQGPSIGPIAGAAASFVTIGVEALGGIVIAVFIGIYGAVDPGVYARALVKLVPPARRERAREVLTRIQSSLFRWLLGQLVLSLAVGLLTCVGLAIAGVPLALALGVLAGALTYVPYLGLLASMVPALLVAATTQPVKMLWVLVVFAIAHGLEGYVFSPYIARRTVEFPPAFTLSVQLFLGAFWGLLGVAFATPIAIVAAVLVHTLYIEDALGDRA